MSIFQSRDEIREPIGYPSRRRLAHLIGRDEFEAEFSK
jgi:hypothetical protein